MSAIRDSLPPATATALATHVRATHYGNAGPDDHRAWSTRSPTAATSTTRSPACPAGTAGFVVCAGAASRRCPGDRLDPLPASRRVPLHRRDTPRVPTYAEMKAAATPDAGPSTRLTPQVEGPVTPPAWTRPVAPTAERLAARRGGTP